MNIFMNFQQCIDLLTFTSCCSQLVHTWQLLD